MTALKFLKEQQRRHINMAESMKVAYFDDELDEAIEELEKLENRTCKNCNWYVHEVCCHHKSPLCADFVSEDYGCILFKDKQ